MKLATTAAAPQLAPRATYDAKNQTSGPVALVRKDGQAPTGDPVVDAAHDNAGVVLDFYSKVLGRDSIDGQGMKIVNVAHYGRQMNNAYWDGSKMVYGDGDGVTFMPFAKALDVVGHEMTHGVTEHTAHLAYKGQSGALNESWSDVFGELIEQWHENRAGFGSTDAAKAADWLIGEDAYTPEVAGDGFRSMKDPGGSHTSMAQPATMSEFVTTSRDEGGVHINSGIPNKAAYEAAIRIGSEKVAKIWYGALTGALTSNATFADAAQATVDVATKLYGAGTVPAAISDAWKSVGLVTKAA